jgi:hypothetical protein
MRCEPIRVSASLSAVEQIVNLVRRHAPDAAIAFNSNPATTYEAAAHWIS